MVRMTLSIASRYFLLISTAGLPYLEEEDEEEIDEKIVIKVAFMLLL
jgi:hypothetical protein